jgi:hypothetical protein
MVNNVETPSQMQSADAVADGRSAGQELQLLPRCRDKSNGLSCSLATTKQRPAHENMWECFIIVSLSRLQEKPISPAMIDLSID